MKKIINVFLILLLLITLVACSSEKENIKDDGIVKGEETPNADNEQEVEEENNQEEIDLAMDQLEKMTLEEKIGQMIMMGFDGYSIDENTKKMVEEHNIGGFIIFGRNVENANQLLTLINELKIANSNKETPLFISVDEEGGRVSRMPDELRKLPTSEWVGTKNDKNLSYNIGNILGEELKSFGFNMDFAPVLDISSNPKNPVIGDRSFGADDEIVKELGIQSMKGLQDTGVISVIKHFPGHGDTSTDSHIELPVVNHDMNRLRNFEIEPFSEAIQQGADAVMIAHILLTQLDPETPASLSRAVITDVLREELNFNGVVITDDMTMGAIVENYGIGDAAIKSIEAGSDIILVAHGYENTLEVINSIKKSIEDGVITVDRIDESVYRILKLKEKYNLADNTIESIDIEGLNSRIDDVLNGS